MERLGRECRICVCLLTYITNTLKGLFHKTELFFDDMNRGGGGAVLGLYKKIC
jgi:hypothetical protein